MNGIVTSGPTYATERPGYVDYDSFVKNWHPDTLTHLQGRADACTKAQARDEWLAVIEELLRRLAAESH
jgi:hypothetical protein